MRVLPRFAQVIPERVYLSVEALVDGDARLRGDAVPEPHNHFVRSFAKLLAERVLKRTYSACIRWRDGYPASGYGEKDAKCTQMATSLEANPTGCQASI